AFWEPSSGIWRQPAGSVIEKPWAVSVILPVPGTFVGCGVGVAAGAAGAGGLGGGGAGGGAALGAWGTGLGGAVPAWGGALVAEQAATRSAAAVPSERGRARRTRAGVIRRTSSFRLRPT